MQNDICKRLLHFGCMRASPTLSYLSDRLYSDPSFLRSEQWKSSNRRASWPSSMVAKSRGMPFSRAKSQTTCNQNLVADFVDCAVTFSIRAAFSSSEREEKRGAQEVEPSILTEKLKWTARLVCLQILVACCNRWTCNELQLHFSTRARFEQMPD